MNDDTFSEFMLGAIILGIAFTWIYPGSAILTLGLFAISAIGVFFFLKGILEFLKGVGTSHLWIGTAMLFTVIVLFKGMNTVAGIFNAIASVINAII